MTSTARVTGFGPFGDVTSNPSSVVASAVAARLREHRWDAVAETLPVTFSTAATAPGRLAGGVDGPLWLVHVGVAEKRERVSLERVAKNRAGLRAGVDGVAPPPVLVADSPDARETSVPLEALATALRMPCGVEISDDAGDYVCNATYYAALTLADARPGVRALFVHVPRLSDDDARTVGVALADALATLA